MRVEGTGMPKVHRDLLLGMLAGLVLLGVLDRTVGLNDRGYWVGLTCLLLISAALLRAFARHGDSELGPADRVTLARTVLACGVAALAADGGERPLSVVALVSLTSVALVLDGVDGWVARRTGTASARGARFDMEVDAFLILVLSLHVAHTVGFWVLVIGGARYLFVAAGWWLPWLRAPLPFRYWRKVVAVIQGVALTLASSRLLPAPVVVALLLVAIALLAESFGRDVWWLRRRSRQGDAARPGPGGRRLSSSTVTSAATPPHDERRTRCPPG